MGFAALPRNALHAAVHTCRNARSGGWWTRCRLKHWQQRKHEAHLQASDIQAEHAHGRVYIMQRQHTSWKSRLTANGQKLDGQALPQQHASLPLLLHMWAVKRLWQHAMHMPCTRGDGHADKQAVTCIHIFYQLPHPHRLIPCSRRYVHTYDAGK